MRGISRTPTGSRGIVKAKTPRSSAISPLPGGGHLPGLQPSRGPQACTALQQRPVLPATDRGRRQSGDESTNARIPDAPATVETHSEEGRLRKQTAKLPGCQEGKGKGGKAVTREARAPGTCTHNMPPLALRSHRTALRRGSARLWFNPHAPREGRVPVALTESSKHSFC